MEIMRGRRQEYAARVKALSCLKRMGEAGADFLIEVLEKWGSDFRWKELIQQIAAEYPAPFLRAARKDDARLQEAIIPVLQHLETPEAAESLILMLRSKSGFAKDTFGRQSIEKALESIAQKKLPPEIVELWTMALTPRELTDRSKSGVLEHSQESLPALKALCGLKHPAVSNILHKISQEGDRSYVGTTFIGNRADHEWQGVLNYKEHRDVATSELAKRKDGYNVEAYFLSKADYNELKQKAVIALNKIKAK
jgi:hypothetical protein